jgi:hypothetical protein
MFCSAQLAFVIATGLSILSDVVRAPQREATAPFRHAGCCLDVVRREVLDCAFVIGMVIRHRILHQRRGSQ